MDEENRTKVHELQLPCFRYPTNMATGTQSLTLEEFQRLYAHQDKAYEFWFGEAVPKAMPTLRHGITQKTVCSLLDGLGYFTSTEVNLHIDPNWQPRPDVLVSTRKFKGSYPTAADDLFVIEILSPEDRWDQVRQKCKNYERLARIETVYLLDPDGREGWRWDRLRQNTEPVQSLAFPNGPELPIARIWERVDQQI